jgi:hypothetical protein
VGVRVRVRVRVRVDADAQPVDQLATQPRRAAGGQDCDELKHNNQLILRDSAVCLFRF